MKRDLIFCGWFYVFRYWNANDACFDADIWMTGERRTDEQ